MSTDGINRALSYLASALDIGSMFVRQVHHHSADIAVEDATHKLTYAALNDQVNRLAHLLLGLGVAHGDRVAILSENRPQFLVLELAAAKLGVIVAAQNWRLAVPELEHCINLVDPRVILVSPRFAVQIRALAHHAEAVVCIDGSWSDRLACCDHTEPVPTQPVMPEDGLIILYTSGTTGLPKGALISHRAMIARGASIYTDLAAGPDKFDSSDAFVAWAPLFHMVSTEMTLATLTHGGGKVVVVDGFNAGQLAWLATHQRIGWLILMPGMITQFIDEMHRIALPVVNVKTIGVMADLVPRHQLAELTSLMNAPYLNSFGSTETGMPPASKGFIGVGEIAQSLAKTQSSYCDIRLVDPDDNEVPDGEPGELTLRGPTLFSGYWNAPEVNAEDFRGGWFHMGDVFVRRADGLLDFVDRRKYLIKSGGENIYPAEIEQVLLADTRIAEAVVVRKHDDRWGEIPVAFVVRKDPALGVDDVIACCNGKIARYKLPKEVRFVDDAELPRSATGKIKRHVLEAMLGRKQQTEASKP